MVRWRRREQSKVAACLICGGDVTASTRGAVEVGFAPWRGERPTMDMEPQFTMWGHEACLRRVVVEPDFELDWADEQDG